MILCIGEILIDMIEKENDDSFSSERFVGGAPFNVATNLSYLNNEVGFIGAIGRDENGEFLYKETKKLNFNYLCLERKDSATTTVALVKLKNGERSFTFLRDNGADYQIDINKIDDALLSRCSIIHLGSFMLSKEEGRRNAFLLIERLKKYNVKISFDVNYREDIFDGNEEALNAIKKIVSNADIVKFSEDELNYFSSLKTMDDKVKEIAKPTQLVLVSLGEKGSCCYFNNVKYVAGTIRIRVVDTTGAGDAFMSGVLSMIDKNGIKNMDKMNFVSMLKFGNVCGAITASERGATTASLKDVE